jgi:hypothetical protein
MNRSLYDQPVSGELKIPPHAWITSELNSEIPLYDPNACIYLVIDAAKTKGPIFRKVAVVDTHLETVIASFLDDHYVEPLNISFNIRGRRMLLQWGREIEHRALSVNQTLPKGYANLLQSISKRSLRACN